MHQPLHLIAVIKICIKPFKSGTFYCYIFLRMLIFGLQTQGCNLQNFHLRPRPFKKTPTKADSSLKKILLKSFPEILNAIFLVFLPIFIDLIFVAKLQSASSFGAVGLSNNFVYLFFKLAEGMSTAGVILMGRYHGGKDYYNCGQAFFETLLTSVVIALAQLCIIFAGARAIFIWMGATERVVTKSAMCMRMHSVAISFLLINMSIMSFFRATGNVAYTFVINGLATMLFIYFDYALLLGKFGYPAVGFLGSAIAAIIRQVFATALGVALICLNTQYHKYFFFQHLKNLTFSGVKRIFKFGLPVTMDKLSLVVAYIWLAKMVAPMGAKAIACADIVKNLERLAFIPATALSQVITPLVSNYIGSREQSLARMAAGYAIAMAIVSTLTALSVICYFSQPLAALFDYKNCLSKDIVFILRCVCPMVAFDVLQLMAAGALRGAGDVGTVLYSRVVGCFGIFIPLSFIVSKYPFQTLQGRILATYTTFYFSTAIIGLMLLKRLLGQAWLEEKIVIMPAQKTEIHQENNLQI